MRGHDITLLYHILLGIMSFISAFELASLYFPLPMNVISYFPQWGLVLVVLTFLYTLKNYLFTACYCFLLVYFHLWLLIESHGYMVLPPK